jgi:hypothetical protein
MSPDAALVFVLSIVLVQVMQVLLLFGVIAQLSRISAQGDRRQPDRAGGRVCSPVSWPNTGTRKGDV